MACAGVSVSQGKSTEGEEVLVQYEPDTSRGYQWKASDSGVRDLGQSFCATGNAMMSSFSFASAGGIQQSAIGRPFTVTIYESDRDVSLGKVVSTQQGVFEWDDANLDGSPWLTFNIEPVRLEKYYYYTIMLSWDEEGLPGQHQAFEHSGDGYVFGRLWQANDGQSPTSSSENDLAFSVQISERIGDPNNPTGIEVSIPAEDRFVAVEREKRRPGASFQVANITEEARAFSVELKLECLTENIGVKSWQVDMNLAAGASQDVDIPAGDLGLYGVYQLSYRVSAGDEVSAWASDIFCVYPRNDQPGPGESVMPIGFSSGAPRCTPRMLELASSLGFEFYRYNIVWGRVQPEPSVWDWQEYDEYLELIKRYNFRWHVLSTWSAPWAAEQRSDPPEVEAWFRWINAVADRYQDDIEFWEVWNEPDLASYSGTVEDYAETQGIAYDAIKAADPDIAVTSGGYASMNHWNTKPGAFEAAIRDYPVSYDWFAYHMHGTFPQFYNDINKQLAVIQLKYDAMDMPFVFTETGFDTRNGERFQAETLMKKMSYAASMGAKSYCWYNIIDRSGRDAPRRMGKTFGLISNPTGTDNFLAIEEEFRPKESFVAAATAVAEIGRLPALETWLEDDGVYAFLFGREGDCLVTAWREDKSLPAPVLVVQDNGAAVRGLDLFGNPFEVATQDGLSLLLLNDPRYFKFSGGTVPDYLGPLVSLRDKVVIGSDGTVKIAMQVWNPLGHPVTLNPEFYGGGDVTVVSSSGAQTIEAGASADITARVAVTPGAIGERTAVQAKLNFEGTSWAPEVEIPIPFNVLDAREGARVLLESVENVQNKQDNDPSTLHLLWASPVDLSVQADFTADEEDGTVRMQFAVKDNALFASTTEEPILDGDALELAWVDADGQTAHLVISPGLANLPRVEFTRNGQPATLPDAPVITISRSEVKQNWNFPTTTYEVILSFEDLGLVDRDSVRFNFSVHDNDGEGPESWIFVSPGMGGSGRVNPEEFITLRVR